MRVGENYINHAKKRVWFEGLHKQVPVRQYAAGTLEGYAPNI